MPLPSLDLSAYNTSPNDYGALDTNFATSPDNYSLSSTSFGDNPNGNGGTSQQTLSQQDFSIVPQLNLGAVTDGGDFSLNSLLTGPGSAITNQIIKTAAGALTPLLGLPSQNTNPTVGTTNVPVAVSGQPPAAQQQNGLLTSILSSYFGGGAPAQASNNNPSSGSALQAMLLPIGLLILAGLLLKKLFA